MPSTGQLLVAGRSQVRGAIFFVGMSCWGSQRVLSLQVPFSFVLKSCVRITAMSSSIPVVAYTAVSFELLLSIKRLLSKYGADLTTEWDAIVKILYSVDHTHVEHKDEVRTLVYDVLTLVRGLQCSDAFGGSDEQYYELIEHFIDVVGDDSSILAAMNHRARRAHPSCARWDDSLLILIAKYMQPKLCSAVRLEALGKVHALWAAYRVTSHAALIERTMLTCLPNVLFDSDAALRSAALSLLAEASRFHATAEFCSFLQLLDRCCCFVEAEHAARIAAVYTETVEYLILHGPPAKAVAAFSSLLQHLSHSDTTLRLALIEWVAALSADRWHRCYVGSRRGVPALFSAVRSSDPIGKAVDARAPPSEVAEAHCLSVTSLLSKWTSLLQHETDSAVLLAAAHALLGHLSQRYLFLKCDLQPLLFVALNHYGDGLAQPSGLPPVHVEMVARLGAALFASQASESNRREIVQRLCALIKPKHNKTYVTESVLSEVLSALSICLAEDRSFSERILHALIDTVAEMCSLEPSVPIAINRSVPAARIPNSTEPADAGVLAPKLLVVLTAFYNFACLLDAAFTPTLAVSLCGVWFAFL
jgi:hypothetical protein